MVKILNCIKIILLIFGFMTAVLIQASAAAHFGCWNEKCWTWCKNRNSGYWCYSTKGDGNIVSCRAGFKCQETWDCASECYPP